MQQHYVSAPHIATTMNADDDDDEEVSATYNPVQIEDGGVVTARRKGCLARGFYHIRKNYKILLFGQLLSLLLASTGAAQATLNLNCGLSAPTFTISVIYLFLSLNLLVVWRRGRRGDESPDSEYPPDQALNSQENGSTKDGVVSTTEPSTVYSFLGLSLHRPAWQYFIFALFDVEANYLTVLAFRYTTLTSVTLFDALAIPSAMIISRCFIGRQYTWVHLLGVTTCMVGVLVNVMQDYESDKQDSSQEYPHKLRGDILAILGGFLFGLNDVLCEVSVRGMGDPTEYLGMLGFFASFISICQALALERQEMEEFFGRNPDVSSQCSVTMGWSLFFVFVACNVCSYMGASRFLLISEAAFFNLSLLTGDMWSVIFSVVAERIVPKPLFFVALIFVLSGVVLYEMAPSPVVEERDEIDSIIAPERLSQGEEEDDPNVELQVAISTEGIY